MTKERVKALNNIGFDWGAIPYRNPLNFKGWQRRYEELKQFKARTGHYRIPQNFTQNKALGRWVSTQRQEYKFLITDRPSQMTIERAEALNDIGFDWEVTTCRKVFDDEGWQRRYNELKQFKVRTGHCKVPVSMMKIKLLEGGLRNNDESIKL